MIRFRMYCIIIAYVLAAAPCFSENKLAMRDIIKLGLANSGEYAIAIEKTKESRYKFKEAWGMLWPEFSTDVAYSMQKVSDGPVFQTTDAYDIKFINGKISVNPGVFYNTLQSTRDLHIAAENDARRIKSEITIKAVQAYCQHILSIKNLELSIIACNAMKDNLSIIEAGFSRGKFSKLDTLRARVSFNTEMTKQIIAENTLKKTLCALNLIIGREPNSPIKKKLFSFNTLSGETSRLLDAAKNDDSEITRLCAIAVSNRPEIIRLKKIKDAEKHNAGISDSLLLWPTFQANASYGTTLMLQKKDTLSSAFNQSSAMDSQKYITSKMTKNLNGMNPNVWKNNFSITLGAVYRWGSLNPIDSSRSKVKQAQSRARQQDFAINDFIKKIRNEVMAAYLNIKSSAKSIEWQKNNIDTTEEMFRTSIREFRSGIIDSSKLQDAIIQTTQSRALYIQALFDYYNAKAELNRALGEEYSE